MKKYRAYAGYKPEIYCQEVVHESPYFLTFVDTRYGRPRECREKKESIDSKWFDAFDEAKEWLIARARSRVEAAQSRLDAYEVELQAVLNMKED